MTGAAMIRHLVCVLFTVGLFAVPCAFAQPPARAVTAQNATARASRHFDDGARLYKQARYREAIAAFEAAYVAKPHGAILFNIAQCHEKLGDLPAALRGYAAYLRDLPNAEDRDTVRLVMKNLEQRLAAGGIQQLRVYSRPTDATVYVDGARAGVTPFSAELPLGRHRVGVEIEGYALNERQIELTADTSAALDFTLEKRTETVPLVDASQEVVPATVPQAALVVPSAETTSGWRPRPGIWTWVSAGVTAAALATAVGFGLSAQNQSDTLMTRQPRTGADATLLRDGAKGSATTSNVLYGVAGVAGAATVGLFFFEGEF